MQEYGCEIRTSPAPCTFGGFKMNHMRESDKKQSNCLVSHMILYYLFFLVYIAYTNRILSKTIPIDI